MKRLLLLFILISSSLAPAFSQAKTPTNQELENRLYKQGVQIDYLLKTLAEAETELKEIKADERNMYAEHTNETKSDIFWYSLIITALVTIIGVGVPIFMKFNLEARITEITKELAKAKEAAKKAEAYALCADAAGASNRESYTRAFEILSQAKKIDKYPFVYTSIGNVYFSQKKYRKALLEYEKAIDLDSNYATAHKNKGDAYYNLEEYTNAINAYTKAIDLDSKYIAAYNNMGNAHLAAGNYGDAADSYTKAIYINDKHISAYYGRQIAYDQLANQATDPTEKNKYEKRSKSDKDMYEKINQEE